MNCTLPPGKYYIGDPCYVFEVSWDAVLSETDYFTNERQTIKGVPVFGGPTAYGDGVYLGSDGFDYSVDAGLLAAIPVELIEDETGAAFGTVVDAPSGLECANHAGAFTFGPISIDTR